jgi:hypothetical protein
VLLAMLGFGDDSPDLHVHFTRHMRALEESDPVEFARLLRTLEESLAQYAAQVHRVRLVLELRLTTEDEDRAAATSSAGTPADA